MADKNDTTYILDSKLALPNKLLQEDGTITDITGKTVINGVDSWKAKQALPNKFLNPDGTYSTLNEIIASMVDTSIYVIVDELPTEGDPQKIYLVSDGKGGFVEYHWIGDKWDPVGMIEFDLENYSTTQEMMNAIEASALVTLNSAKAYADELVSDLVPDIYYLSKAPTGTSTNWSSEAVAELQAIRDTNSDAPCIIMFGGYAYFSPTHKLTSGSIVFNKIAPVLKEETILSVGYSSTKTFIIRVVLTVNADGVITKVSSGSSTDTMTRFINPTTTYTTAFIPTHDSHPATKKYVDDTVSDAISTNITQVLNESY